MKNHDTTYLVIGSGRTARHMNHYLQSLNIPTLQWNRSQSTSRLLELCDKAQIICLAISDSQIESFFKLHFSNRQSQKKSVLSDANKKFLHFSGALHIPEIQDAHPLMTFGPDLYDLKTYQEMHFVTCSKDSGLLPGLPNSVHQIQIQEKVKYHAMCVASGNFATLLWQKMAFEFEKMNLPLSIAKPYLKQVLENTLANPTRALTGPFARKDFATIALHQNIFADDEFLKIYQAFTQVYCPEFQTKNENEKSESDQ